MIESFAILVVLFDESDYRLKWEERFPDIPIYFVDNHANFRGEGCDRYWHNGNIGGISGAVNMGMHNLHELGFKWVGVFDEDTNVSMSEYMPGLISNSASDIGMYVPFIQLDGLDTIQNKYVIYRDGRLRKEIGQDMLDVFYAITSGSLIRMSAWLQCGGYNANYFIEYVDNEFAIRLQREGYKILLSKHLNIIQPFGVPEVKNFLGFKRIITRHDSWRYFLRGRNKVWMIKRHVMYVPYLLLWEFISSGSTLFNILIEGTLLTSGLEYIKGIIYGIIKSEG